MRVPFLKRDRPEVEELTGQRWVPVLVHGEEVIRDSHRILEYLERVEQQVLRPRIPRTTGAHRATRAPAPGVARGRSC